MAKSTRRRAPLSEPLPPINPLLSTKETLPEALLGKDITKPRDLYTLLSLGHLPINSLQWPNETALRNPEGKGVKVLSTFTASSKQLDDALSQNSSSYFQFDAHNPITGLPVLPAITRVSSASCSDDDENGNGFLNEDHILYENLPRKSIINEEDHKIKISTTYIFAPTERLHETVKYKRNVALPKIKPKKSPPRENSPQSNAVVVFQNTSTKADRVEESSFSPRKSDMHATNSLFGVRPECLFMNNQLGQRNPLIRTNKESPSQLVPKASPGLNDLKDYEEYPDAYWKLRDGTIAQPEDLEADMIDRDLYRLRQISTLKLNTINRTYQVNQDPFRKWRGKTGEPIFSPRQQQKPWNRFRKDRMKLTEVPTYPQPMHNKPIHGMKISCLKLPTNNNDLENGQAPLSHRAIESNRTKHNDSSPNGKELGIAIGETQDETPFETAMEQTPRDILAASLDTYRKLEEEREEQTNGEDLSIERLHQLKGKKEKKMIKTPLAHVNLDSLETYKREHRAAPRRQMSDPQNNRSLNNSTHRDSLVNTNPNSNLVSPRVDTARSPRVNGNGNYARKESDKDIRKGSDPSSGNGKLPVKAPVVSISFRPQSERYPECLLSARDVPAEHYDEGSKFIIQGTNANARPGISSPNLSDASTAGKERRTAGNPQLRAVQLEVFAERRDFQSPIKIPTGRTTYHPSLPSCKLDLINYPPSNARQTCGKRSSSAGMTEGRQTQLTFSTRASRQRLESSEARSVIPPKSSDNSGVNIRFGGQGKVIVTSSREGRRSR